LRIFCGGKREKGPAKREKVKPKGKTVNLNQGNERQDKPNRAMASTLCCISGPVFGLSKPKLK
jgi:hypothetical protein